MLNIADATKEFIKWFRKECNNTSIDLNHPYVGTLYPSMQENWGENYALCNDLYYDEPQSAFFDSDGFTAYIEDKIRKYFRKLDKTVKVKFHWRSQELEIFR